MTSYKNGQSTPSLITEEESNQVLIVHEEKPFVSRLADTTIYSQPITQQSIRQNAPSQSTSVIKKLEQDVESYRKLERRALLQTVHNDERQAQNIATFLHKATGTTPDEIDNETMIQLFEGLANIMLEYVQEHRKATLQVVRDTEKRYAMKPKVSKDTNGLMVNKKQLKKV